MKKIIILITSLFAASIYASTDATQPGPDSYSQTPQSTDQNAGTNPNSNNAGNSENTPNTNNPTNNNADNSNASTDQENNDPNSAPTDE